MKEYVCGDVIYVFMDDSEVKKIIAEKTGFKEEWINCYGIEIKIPIEGKNNGQRNTNDSRRETDCHYI